MQLNETLGNDFTPLIVLGVKQSLKTNKSVVG